MLNGVLVCNKPKFRAFTLVELLVVISIIALLLAVMMPGLGRARRQARKVICQANEHQLLTGWVAYAMNNNDMMATPVRWGTNPWWEGQWPYRFTGYLHNYTADKYNIGREEWKQTAMYCPAAKNLLPPDIYYSAITYAINAFLGGTWNADGSLSVRSDPYDNTIVTKMKLTQVKNPSYTMVWVDAGVGGRASLDLAAPQAYVRQASIRHLGKSNIVYVDGHVEWSLPKTNKEMNIILLGQPQ